MKICQSIDQLNIQLEQNKGKKIVFTNGVFDLIHHGHIELLEFARNQGDLLVLGLNSDSSVKSLKGDKRPIFSLEERFEILSCIEYVDYLIAFEEDTPEQLVNALYKIDILVKGGDYSDQKVVGRERVERDGGEVRIFQFKSDISTSKLIETIKKS